MKTIPRLHPKINRKTVSYLRTNPLPGGMRHLRQTIVQLPMPVVFALADAAAAHGLGDEGFAAGLSAAVQYQSQSAKRCCACFRWLDAPNLSLVCVAAGAIAIHALCATCERKHVTDDDICTAAAGYVGAVAQ